MGMQTAWRSGRAGRAKTCKTTTTTTTTKTTTTTTTTTMNEDDDDDDDDETTTKERTSLPRPGSPRPERLANTALGASARPASCAPDVRDWGHRMGEEEGKRARTDEETIGAETTTSGVREAPPPQAAPPRAAPGNLRKTTQGERPGAGGGEGPFNDAPNPTA